MKSKLFVMLVVALCALGVTGYAMAAELLTNEGFENWTVNGAAGPPDNWTKYYYTYFEAFKESTIVHGGSYSTRCKWWTTDNRDLRQQYIQVTGGQTYKLDFYAYDNDPKGECRGGIVWYPGSASNYGPSYTSDLAGWQLMSFFATAPATAESARINIRMYDVSPFDTATIYIDDASFQPYTPPPPDTLTIYQVQHNNTQPGLGAEDCYPSPEKDSVVVISGIVTQVLPGTFKNFWLQEADSVWSGIFIFDNSVIPLRGDSITITGTVMEYHGCTQLTSVSNPITHSGGHTLPVPVNITPGDLAGGCSDTSEAYEGILVKIQNVVCTQGADGYGRWWVTDGTDTCMIDDGGGLSYTPFVGEQFDYIIGMVSYYKGDGDDDYSINPRDFDDIPPRLLISDISHRPTISGLLQNVTVKAFITDPTKGVDTTSVQYVVDDTTLAWTGAPSDSTSESYYYYTIPGQASACTVYYRIWAKNTAGAISMSSTRRYPVFENVPDIVINEILYDTPGTDAGCFIEIKGAPKMPLSGYSLVGVNGANGQDYRTITFVEKDSIPQDGYFVIAQDATVANRDTITADADLQNGPDNLQLRKGGFVYDAVGYGSFGPNEYFAGEGYPTYDPYILAIGRDSLSTDTDYNRRDFGVYSIDHATPGSKNLGPVEYTIKEIQQLGAKQDTSAHFGERVIVGGVVTVDTACTYNPGYYIEMSSGGYWSGVLIYDLYNEPERGDTVQVIGTVQEEYHRTQVGYITGYTNAGSGSMPSAMVVPTAQVAVAESLEGVLVEVQCVEVVDTLGYGEYWITDGAITDTCMVDDICGYSTEVLPGDQFAAIRGVVDYSFNRYKIQPRDDADLVLPPVPIVRAAKSGADLHLEWTPATKALVVDYYIIYRSTDPNASGDSLGITTPPETTYTDAGAVGDLGTHYFYMVKARYTCGIESGDSRRVGEFDKSLSKVK